MDIYNHILESARIMFVQYGDFKEASIRFSKGLNETYYAQRYSVRWVEDLKKSVRAVYVLSLNVPNENERILPSGVIFSGMNYWLDIKRNKTLLLTRLQDFKPSHIILRTPLLSVLRWSIKHKIKIFPIFADSFSKPSKGIKAFIRYLFLSRHLSKVLNNAHIEFVANHNVPACDSLRKIGVQTNKIVPWDWPPIEPINMFKPKQLEPKFEYKLFYAGSISKEKGVGDLIEAVALLKERNIYTCLTVVGSGKIDKMKSLAQKRGIYNCVNFIGEVENPEVLSLMSQHDIVIVPSRPSYAEGFPKTINEAMASSTPLIASNHPMFMSHLLHKKNALIFEAENVKDLADNIFLLLNCAELYSQLSLKSHENYKKLFVPTLWGDLIKHWLIGENSDRDWIYDKTLDKVKLLN